MTIKTALPAIPTPKELSALHGAMEVIIAKLITSPDAGQTPIDITEAMTLLSDPIRLQALTMLKNKGWEWQYYPEQRDYSNERWTVQAPTTRSAIEGDAAALGIMQDCSRTARKTRSA